MRPVVREPVPKIFNPTSASIAIFVSILRSGFYKRSAPASPLPQPQFSHTSTENNEIEDTHFDERNNLVEHIKARNICESSVTRNLTMDERDIGNKEEGTHKSSHVNTQKKQTGKKRENENQNNQGIILALQFRTEKTENKNREEGANESSQASRHKEKESESVEESRQINHPPVFTNEKQKSENWVIPVCVPVTQEVSTKDGKQGEQKSRDENGGDTIISMLSNDTKEMETGHFMNEGRSEAKCSKSFPTDKHESQVFNENDLNNYEGREMQDNEPPEKEIAQSSNHITSSIMPDYVQSMLNDKTNKREHNPIHPPSTCSDTVLLSEALPSSTNISQCYGNAMPPINQTLSFEVNKNWRKESKEIGRSPGNEILDSSKHLISSSMIADCVRPAVSDKAGQEDLQKTVCPQNPSVRKKQGQKRNEEYKDQEFGNEVGNCEEAQEENAIEKKAQKERKVIEEVETTKEKEVLGVEERENEEGSDDEDDYIEEEDKDEKIVGIKNRNQEKTMKQRITQLPHHPSVILVQ